MLVVIYNHGNKNYILKTDSSQIASQELKSYLNFDPTSQRSWMEAWWMQSREEEKFQPSLSSHLIPYSSIPPEGLSPGKRRIKWLPESVLRSRCVSRTWMCVFTAWTETKADRTGGDSYMSAVAVTWPHLLSAMSPLRSLRVTWMFQRRSLWEAARHDSKKRHADFPNWSTNTSRPAEVIL